LSSATPALGKGNGRHQPEGTLCRLPTWQALGKNIFLKKFFAECDVSGTRQRFYFFFKKSLCRVLALGKGLVTLPSATPALSKAGLC
jgi:hypothetical protein